MRAHRLNPLALPCLLAAALGALASCKEPPAPENPAASSAAAPSASPPAAPSAAASSSPAASPSPPFHVVATFDSAASLHPIDGGAFVVSASGLLVIDGDDLTFDPKWQAGLDALNAKGKSGTITQVGGRFPDAVFIATIEDAPVPGGTGSAVYGFSGGRFTARSKIVDNLTIVDMAPWQGGQTLAVFSGQTGSDMRFKAFGGTPSWIPQPDVDADQNALCRATLQPDVFTALPSGEVFAAGTTCKPTPEGYMPAGNVVERWPKGVARGVIDQLPEPTPLRFLGIVALAPNDVYVAGDPPDQPGRRDPGAPAYFAHYDGASWQPARLPLEAKGNLTAIAGGADGKLWAVLGNDLFRREPDGTWARHPIPPIGKEPPTAASMWVRGPDDVWVMSSAPRSATLFHTRPPTKAFVPPATK